MSESSLALIAGAVLSLGFSYIPFGFNVKFAALSGEVKRLIMAGLLLVVAGSIYGLSCAGWGASFGITVVCDQAGAMNLIQVFVLALIANQSAYAITPQTSAVREAS